MIDGARSYLRGTVRRARRFERREVKDFRDWIDSERPRRDAEDVLANLVETFDGRIETRVAREPIERFVRRAGRTRDLVFLGASTDRSAASRFVSRPTFERIADVDCDVAIVHRG